MKKSELKNIIKEEIKSVLNESIDDLQILYDFLKRRLFMRGAYKIRINPAEGLIESYNLHKTETDPEYYLLIKKVIDGLDVTAGSLFENTKNQTEHFDIAKMNDILSFIQNKFKVA